MNFDKDTKELLINDGYNQFMMKYKDTIYSKKTNPENYSVSSSIEIVSQNNENIDEMIHSLQDELKSNDYSN